MGISGIVMKNLQSFILSLLVVLFCFSTLLFSNTSPHTYLIVTHKEKDGIVIREDANSESKKRGELFQQHKIPLKQIGATKEEGDETWVQVEAKGWMVTHSRTFTYMTRVSEGGNKWKVTWYKPEDEDEYVSMRSGPSTSRKRISKVWYETIVEEIDSEKVGDDHYIFGKYSGWVLMKDAESENVKEIDPQ